MGSDPAYEETLKVIGQRFIEARLAVKAATSDLALADVAMRKATKVASQKEKDLATAFDASMKRSALVDLAVSLGIARAASESTTVHHADCLHRLAQAKDAEATALSDLIGACMVVT